MNSLTFKSKVQVAMIHNKPVTDYMPKHLKRWIKVAQMLPTILMGLTTLAAMFSNSPVGTLAYLNRQGISNIEFGVVCLISTVYLVVASRKLNWQSALHFALGTLPIVFFTFITLLLVLRNELALNALTIYVFAYGALVVLYWLAIALAEWSSNITHVEANKT